MVLRILAIIVLVLVPLDFALAIEMYGDEGTPLWISVFLAGAFAWAVCMIIIKTQTRSKT